MILLDTSGVLAAYDTAQLGHVDALRALRETPPPRLLSPFVLAELDYMVTRHVGRVAARSMLEEVVGGVFRLETFVASDVAEASDILDRYRGVDLGLTDASIVVLARRFGAIDVLTLDERHFRVLRGPRDRPFRLLPADA